MKASKQGRKVWNLHCIVQVAVLVEEPEHAVVGLRVDALLLQGGDFLRLAGYQVQFEHFKEGVSVLGSELNRKVQVVLGVGELAVLVVHFVRH